MRHEIHQSAALSPRAATFVGIAALHVCFAYLFMSGLAQSAFKQISEPMRLIPVPPETPLTPEKVPIVDRPKFEPLTIDVPLPPDPRFLPTEETVTATYTPEPTPTAGTAAIVPPPVEQIRLVGTNRIPNAESYYPASLKRQGVEGATVVRACVDERGRLQGDPVVTRSSGYEGFDKGALEAARDGRYARATQGGKPVPYCHNFKVTFIVVSR